MAKGKPGILDIRIGADSKPFGKAVRTVLADTKKLRAGFADIRASLRRGGGGIKAFTRGLGQLGGAFKGLAKSMAKAGAAAAIGVLTVAMGVATKAALSMDAAFKKFQRSSGDFSLDSGNLEAFNEAASSVPDDLDLVGEAFGLTSRITDESADRVGELTEKYLDYSRVVGGDPMVVTEGISKVFRDTSMAIDEQDASLDRMTRASQTYGVSADELSLAWQKQHQSLSALGVPLEEQPFLLAQIISTVGEMEKVHPLLRKGWEENGDAVAGLNAEMEKLMAMPEAKRMDFIMKSWEIDSENAMALLALAESGGFSVDFAQSIADSEGALAEAIERGTTTQEKLDEALNALRIKLGTAMAPAIEGLIEALEEIDVEALGDSMAALLETVSKHMPEIVSLLGFILEAVAGR